MLMIIPAQIQMIPPMMMTYSLKAHLSSILQKSYPTLQVQTQMDDQYSHESQSSSSMQQLIDIIIQGTSTT